MFASKRKIFQRRNSGWRKPRALFKLRPMRLHDRYFFRELLTPLAFCLGGFGIFWLFIFFFTRLNDIHEANLDAGDTLEFALANLPEFFVLLLPVLLLLSLLYALTHHSRHNEITALRAAGVGLWRLCAPYFVVGIITSGIYFAMSEIAVPACQKWSAEILLRHVQHAGASVSKTHFSKVAFRSARANRIWQIGDYDSATTTMTGVGVNWTLSDGSWRALQAERGILTNGVWTFFNAQLYSQLTPRGRLIPQFSTNQIAMPDFDETPKQILLEIKFSDAQLLRGRTADIPLVELWPYLQLHSQFSSSEAAQIFTKFHGRIAAPWTCLVVVLIAIPFGAAPGRRNLFFGVAGSIFIGFTFFVTQSVSLALGAGGSLTPWLAAWLPNLIFAVVGIFLTLRIR